MSKKNMINAKRILSFIMAMMIVVSIIPATSIVSNASSGYTQLSEDGFYLYVYNNPEEIVVPDSVQELVFYDSDVCDPIDCDNGRIVSISFNDCRIFTEELGSFAKLDLVKMVNCYMYDLQFLSENREITYIDLDSCHIKSLNGIQALSELEYLYLADVGIETIEEIKYNYNLEELILYNTCVTDLSPIEDMKIQHLDISNTLSIRDLTPVMTLDKLESFISINCEMAYTQELCHFLEDNRIYNCVSDEWENIQREVKGIADELFTYYMTDDEIIEATTGYIIDKMTYDTRVETDEDLSLTYNLRALGYALEGIGVCRNYSALATVLLQEAGILVYEIKSKDHIWNIINLDGEFFWLDVTWLDDSDEDFRTSDWYMNDNYFFVAHDELTHPSSMYETVNVGLELFFTIINPSRKAIRYKDGIILHTNFENADAEGMTVKWEWDNDSFIVEENEDGTITVISDGKGATMFTAQLMDEDGNVIAFDQVEINSKAGLFDRISGFFRSIFGLTKIYKY